MGIEGLEHPNNHFLSAAQGWLELGNETEALEELKKIPEGLQEHPAVLEVRWNLECHAKRWAEALAIAEALHRIVPANPAPWIHRSFCLHELRRTQEAWDGLLPAVHLFPKEWLICYNLACYACQLGRLDEGKNWLMRAIELGDPIEINRIASNDPDLKPLTGSP